MQQNHQHTDQKLRDLESQSLPDLSKIDEHWEQFKNSLRPVNTNGPMRTPRRYTWWIVAAAIMIGTILIATYLSSNQRENIAAVLPEDDNEQILIDTVPGAKKVDSAAPATSKKKRTSKTPVVPASPKKSTTPIDTATTSPRKNIAKRKTSTTHFKNDTIILKKKNPTKARQRILLEVRTTDGIDTVLEATTTSEDYNVSPSHALKLESFFRELEKVAEEFIIDNSRDTILIGDEGTALLIPANAFSSSNRNISIQLKEYYTYEDIITNRINTTSNGEPLITGGMIHLSAQSDGRELELKPGRSIRWFIPGNNQSLNGMSLFTGDDKNNKSSLSSTSKDSTTGKKNRIINWQQREQLFRTNYVTTTVKVLDLRNEPFRVKQKTNGDIGFFGLSPVSQISKDEAVVQLKEKYGYYKVRVRKLKTDYRARSSSNVFTDKYTGQAVGDSTWVEPFVANTYNLKFSETMISTNTGYNYSFAADDKESQLNMTQVIQKLSARFSVDINSLGWMNCDKFYDKSDRIDYYVDLNDNAENYCAMLVFQKMKGMVMGQISNQRVVFRGVPESEPAIVVCMGMQNGQPVSAMQAVKLSRMPLTSLKFEETTPEEFKRQAAGLDKQ